MSNSAGSVELLSHRCTSAAMMLSPGSKASSVSVTLLIVYILDDGMHEDAGVNAVTGVDGILMLATVAPFRYTIAPSVAINASVPYS